MRDFVPANSSLTTIVRLSLVICVAMFLFASLAPTAYMQERTPGQLMQRVDAKISRVENSESSNAHDAAAANPLAPEVASNYAFGTATNASLTNMSSGTTQLIAADQDDVASAVTLIGFDYYFQGARQDRFSVNSNGTLRFGSTPISTTLYDPLAQAGQSLITPYGADQRTHIGNGKVHFKVTGAAPNRVLIVEWLNMQSDFNSGGTADLTYQLRLYETTGAIEFVYGSMSMSAAGAADPNSLSPQMGFSSNSTVGTVGSITAAQGGAPAPTFSGASATPVNNTYVAGTITVLTSAVDGSRRIFTLTPPVVTAPGGPLTFTGVATTVMTLNWTDSPNELGYAIYISTDGTNFSFFNTAAQNATAFAASGLTGSTTYFWRVYAVNEGSTAFISGSQATNAPTPNSSLSTGLWSNPGTWSTGSVPGINDAVTIAAGTTVTIDIGASAYSLNVPSGGILQFEQTTARTLTVTTDATIQSGGTVQSNPAGTTTTHNLSISGNLTNNGTLDFSTNADTAGAIITFTGASNATFSGTGATNDIRQITMNKGTTFDPIVEITTSNFTVRGVTTDTVVGGWLVMTSGTIKVSGTFTGTSRVFSAAAYTIPAAAGFWLNNPNYTVAGQNGSPTQSGLLRVSQGTFNIGTATGNSMGFSTGSTTVVEGGAVKGTSRFGVDAAGNSITYTQTGGTITVNTIGNASATLGSFDLGTSLTSNITVSGGTIVTQLAATAIDYRDQAGSGALGVTGGTLQLGNAASGAAKAFMIRGVVPNLVISNASANHSASWSTTLVNYNNISRDITINTGNTLNLGNVVFLFNGTTLTNNGTLTHNGASSAFIWFSTAAGTYTGSGVVTAPMTLFASQNDGGITINPASPNIVTTDFVLFNGNVTNANKITLGNGGATSGIVQIGSTTTPTNAGALDVPFTFNLGTGGEIISYLRTTTSRSTGPEINPTRSITTFTYDDNDVTHALTLAGGDLTVTGTTTLTNGRVITAANTFIIGNAGTVARTNGSIDGNFRKTYTAAGSKTFEVGTANGYSPVTVNTTAGTFPADFTVKAIQGPQPSVNPSKSIQRYWTLTEGGDVTADLTFNYLDPTDIMGTEANYKVIRVIGGTAVAFPTSVVTPAANTAALTGVTTFSDWTVGEIAAPTAAPATISGQVTTTSGAPIPGVTMYLSGARSARAITDAQGNYRFFNIDTDNFYTVTPTISNYHFSPSSRSFSLLANKTDAVFTGTLDPASSGNVIDMPEYFVRQHYLDFLGREPDEAGFNFWSDQIAGCGNDFNCVERRTINVSAAYFLSIEFQETGGLVDGLYRASYLRAPSYAEFMPDTARVAHNVIVNQVGWEGVLAANKAEFLNAWVERPEFHAAYDNLTNEAYIDALIGHTGATFTGDERATLVNGLNNNTLTRAVALERIAENERFQKAKFNEAFVRMEYFGYLRRDPDDAGFHFWLNKLNQFDGNFEQAEMVKAFIVSTEYRARFQH